MELNVERIARIVHETNRAYCASIGDFSQVSWEDAPDWQRNSAIDGVKFHLKSLSNGELPSGIESHYAWVQDKIKDGWTYGPVKDAEKKQHPCIVAYVDLPVEQRLKDYLFASVVEAFFRASKE